MSKIKYFIFCFVLIVSCLCSSISAFAITDMATYEDLVNIANTYGLITKSNTVAYISNGSYCLVNYDTPGKTCYYNNTLVIKAGTLTPAQGTIVTFNSSNIYATPTSTPFNQYSYDYGIHNVNSIIGSTVDIYENFNSDLVVFQQGSQSTTSSLTPNLSSFLSSTHLSGILNECIQILPVLLPVLVSFLAIRKGLQMIFGQLKMA